ncbi:5-hydroxytryptamine receptor 1D-like [Dendronephthya gigantea]|uniref:5-hydroxytryptamine receptor 1D-like n=1 Tax=Dendronephthya gigantea TaxID=151771 RepID=UPI00106CDA25|nr:5-hydroxytryptamine receptor 1D-like [Dendronephthya gigantea]
MWLLYSYAAYGYMRQLILASNWVKHYLKTQRSNSRCFRKAVFYLLIITKLYVNKTVVGVTLVISYVIMTRVTLVIFGKFSPVKEKTKCVSFLSTRTMNGSTVLTEVWLKTSTSTVSSQQQTVFPKGPIWIATTVLLVIILIATVLGNTLVLATTWLDKRLHQPNKYFIASLAVADLFVGVLSAPIRLHMQLFQAKLHPIGLCRVWTWFDCFCEMASILTLMVISADRYSKISQPFKYRIRMNTSKSVIVIANIWFISTVSATFSLSSFGESAGIMSVAGRGCVNDNKMYYTIISILFFFVPSVIIILMYALIFYIAHRRQNMNRRGELGQSFAGTKNDKKNKELRQELKTIRMLALVVCTFIVCWAPSFVLLLINFYKPEYLIPLTLHEQQIIGSLFITILPYFNSMCNPLIYACFDREYSNAFKHLLQRYNLCRRLTRQNTETSLSSATRRTYIRESTRGTRNSSSSRLMIELAKNAPDSPS